MMSRSLNGGYKIEKSFIETTNFNDMDKLYETILFLDSIKMPQGNDFIKLFYDYMVSTHYCYLKPNLSLVDKANSSKLDVDVSDNNSINEAIIDCYKRYRDLYIDYSEIINPWIIEFKKLQELGVISEEEFDYYSKLNFDSYGMHEVRMFIADRLNNKDLRSGTEIAQENRCISILNNTSGFGKRGLIELRKSGLYNLGSRDKDDLLKFEDNKNELSALCYVKKKTLR